MFGFQGMMYMLEQWGVIDVILPFILIFTIVFAIFEETKILSSDPASNKKYSTIVAIVLAFSVVIPHITGSYYYGFDAVEIINKALPQIGLLLVSIVMILLALGIWTGKKADGTKGIGQWLSILSGLIVVVIFIASLGYWQVPYWLMWFLSSDVLALIVAMLVFVGIIVWISSSPSKEKDKEKAKKISSGLGEFLSGVSESSGKNK